LGPFRYLCKLTVRRFLENEQTIPSTKAPWPSARKIAYIAGTLILFVFSLNLMTTSLQHMGNTMAETILLATSNPFTALFIGLLITAMIQSSSATTSLVVALVAAGSISLESAIPIIMGANVGTTITSTIVALGFINKKKEFRRAVAAGTYHDFFNILTVIILFPLEYYYGVLSRLSQWLSVTFFPQYVQEGTASSGGGWGLGFLVDWIVQVFPSGFILALLSFVLLFISILVFRKIISGILSASSPESFSRFFFKNQGKSFFWGLVTTAAIRSSTITTSVVVPIVAQKIIPLRKAAPFIMGANIGTTVTAFIAAIVNTHSSSAISIALAHFLFNFIGVLIFWPVPFLRNIPMLLASRLGKLTLKYRLVGLVYILLFFFFIPFSLIYVNKDSVEVVEATYERKNEASGQTSHYRIVSKTQRHTHIGEWIVYSDSLSADPALIYQVYRKNNILFIKKEMFMFTRPGFCWDSENTKGKYEMCIDTVLSDFQPAPGLRFDSVYVYRQHFSTPDSLVKKYYISPLFPVILRKETYAGGLPVETEQIARFTRN
jgi:sodium-dependent phosphate cotransporter